MSRDTGFVLGFSTAGGDGNARSGELTGLFGAATERAPGIRGDYGSASVSYTDFRLDHHIARKAVSPSLKLLDHLGLIEIEPGTAACERLSAQSPLVQH